MPAIRANGIALEYESLGPDDGIPFLMIAGFATQMIVWPDEFHAALTAAGIRYIRFDNRDCGLSQKWDGVLPDPRAVLRAVRAGETPDVPYRLADMAADAAGLLDALGIASAHICGFSMGGMIAQLVALDRPEKTRSLIAMFSTTGDPALPPAAPEVIAALTARPAQEDRDGVIAHVLGMRKIYASPGFPFETERLTRRIGESYDRSYYPEGALRQWTAILAAPPRTERLKTLKRPALVLHGADDPLIRVEGGRHTAAVIPGAEYHEIAGWAHDMPLPLIPRVAGYILDFVKRVEGGRE